MSKAVRERSIVKIHKWEDNFKGEVLPRARIPGPVRLPIPQVLHQEDEPPRMFSLESQLDLILGESDGWWK